MRIKVLSDNRILSPELKKEHGLCIYIETEKYKCLLDTGASSNFIENAEKVEVDIPDIDYVFISHGHSDHIGGLDAFLQLNTKAKIIISQNALSQRFYSSRNGMKKISSDIDFTAYKERFIFVDSEIVLENEIHVFPCTTFHFPMPKANKTLLKENGNGLLSDDFNHELIISFGENEQVVYTGCAHCGILNILDSVKTTINKPIKVLIGGFHLLDGIDNQYETEKEITDIAERIITEFPDTKFYTGHCTGEKAYSLIKQKLDSAIHWFYTGFVTTIELN
ncbi:MAG: MBL fold metallo-hydrolase [Paludibacter sp.]|nr:MBL fold metallo-hydrolase [Paludibacter sp.]